ncbi:hypothetical protein [Actinomadura chibensis]|uniref:TrbC/VirB2 family protein n=1 Tax=Actinomadura chibensis TaxID=392828 RepID=A0A5D0NV49_9ACTN|nr:hypothetical protein [Actinomadura chibensis]TYB48560.1 hypothetical protein FXF69_05065 [Actinomadura chibensis]
MLIAAATGGDGVLAGDLIDWVQLKEGEIKGLVPGLLWLAAVFFAIVAWVVARSWKKAMVAGIGGAIVIAVVNQLGNLSDKVGTEIEGAPARPPAVVVAADGARTPT